MKQATKI